MKIDMQRKPFYQQFEYWAGAHPELIAVQSDAISLTYAQLNRWGNAIAQQLLPETTATHIGILIDSQAAYIAASLAVGKAGKCFVPLDVNLPEARLSYQINKLGIRDILCTTDTASRCKGIAGQQIIAVDAFASQMQDKTLDQNLNIDVKGSDPCYVMFTSGSTGAPKAVLGQHKGLTHFINWEKETFGIAPADVFSWMAPTTFDVSLRDIWVPLTAGGSLAIPSEEDKRQAHRLLPWLERRKVTHMHLIPSIFRLMINSLAEQGHASAVPKHLRRILLAGEPLHYQDINAWRAFAGEQVELVNLYGPTETTLAKVFHVLASVENGEGIVPIGMPLPQTNVLIIANGQLCRAGEIGEIYIRTPYRSLGYCNDDVATNAVFVQNPLHDDQVDILYKTGDLGRYIEQGRIVCLGRTDNQVKINGVRIELGEVEAACRSVEGIRQVAVKAIEQGQDKSLCCYYNRSPDAAYLGDDTLRDLLSARLPSACVPQLFVYVEKFPTLINGKINRKALPKPEEVLYAGRECVVPKNETEERLALIWQDILGQRRVCTETPFYELGGDSFKMMRVLSAIYQVFGQEIPLKDWMQDSRITTLAGRLQGKSNEVQAITKAPVGEHYPTTAGQLRLWTLYKMQQGHQVYNLPEEYIVTGDLNIDALRAACAAVVAKHSILRTRFVEIDEQVYQQVSDNLDGYFSIEHHQRIDEVLVDRLVADQASYLFDLQHGPLFYLKVLQCKTTGKSLLLFNIHHIISDGWSLAIFARELSDNYVAVVAGQSLNPVTPDIDFKDYAVWYESNIVDEKAQKARQWWMDSLRAPLPILDLPTDYPRPAVRRFEGRTVNTLIPVPILNKLQALLERHNISLYCALQLVIRLMLQRFTAQNDVIIGCPTAGRTRTELEPVMGYFVNTLPVRFQLDLDSPIDSALESLSAALNDCFQYQDYPIDALIDELDIARDLSRSPLYDVIVVLQNFDTQGLTLGDATVTPVEKASQWNTSRCDMVFHFQQAEEGLLLELNYNTEIFTCKRIARYADYVVHLMEQVAASQDSSQTLSELELLPEHERLKLLAYGRGQSVPVPDRQIPALFAQVASQYSENIALTDGTETLSYNVLNAQSDALVQAIMMLDVNQGDVVALAYDRGISSIVLLLAILKAQCVYMPLDVDLPEERIRQQLSDSGAKLVLLADGQSDTDIPATVRCFTRAQLMAQQKTKVIAPEYGKSNAPAYLIYTSGSTGQPKGVLLNHAGFVNMSLHQIQTFDVTQTSRVLQFAPMSFDASMANIFMALFSGAALVLIEREVIEQPQRFLKFMTQQGITVVTLPPSYLAALSRPPMPTVKTLITAGEEAITEDLRYYADTMACFNAYGPTEISVCATIESFTAQSINEHEQVVLGKPTANTHLLVLTEDKCLAATGVVGELCIAGCGVAFGYHNAPELTEHAFSEVPEHLSLQSQRLYRSGDMVYWDDAGRLNFVGRKDSQLKVNGFRVDAQEIKQAIESHPEVESAFIAKTSDGSRLASWVIPKRKPELWPSVAEFYVYDDVLYSSMANDEARNQMYRAAFAKHLKDKVVLEIGPGSEVILSRLAIEAGAKKVYAVELLQSTYEKAKQRVAQLGLEAQIELINADIRYVELPEKADWCISEIVGSIGGSEGSAVLINSARRLLKQPENMLPMRSLTNLAAVTLDHEPFYQGFSDIAGHYVDEIFKAQGEPFDLRMCIKNLPGDSVISDIGVLEDLDYTAEMEPEERHETTITIAQNSQLSGLIFWLQLYVDNDHYVDSLFAEKSWLPVYLPLFDGDYQTVEQGDQLCLTVERKLHANQLNPDFIITGELRQKHQVLPISCASWHVAQGFKQSAFYQRVFANYGQQTKSGHGLTEQALRKHLAARLPGYSMPGMIQFIEQFPLTANGKIDKHLLPERPVQSAEPRQLNNEVEKLIAETWQSVLDVENVSLDDNFFSLGGDSISAIKVVSMLAQHKLSVSVRDIFLNPTVSGLANVCQSSTVQVEQGMIKGRFELSAVQKWAMATFKEQQFEFNQGCLLSLETKVAPDTLKAAVRKLVVHHDMLRCRIVDTDEGYQQVITDTVEFAFEELNLPNKAQPETLSEADLQPVMPRFSVNEPLFKVVLIRLKAQDVVLLVTNHLIVDAVSWRILIEDFTGLLLGDTQLMAKSESYVNWAAHLKSLADASHPGLHRHHWQKLHQHWLDESGQKPSRRIHGNSEYVTFTIERQWLDKLTECVKQTRFSMEEVYLCALSEALHGLTGRPQNWVTVESHGRNSIVTDSPQPDVSRTVGWFTCYYPFLLSQGASTDDTLASLRQQKESLPEPGPAYMLSRWLTPEGDSYHIAPHVLFNYVGDFSFAEENKRGIRLEFDIPAQLIGAELPCPHAIDWLMLLKNEGLSIAVSFTKQDYSGQQIDGLLKDFKQSLNAIHAHLTEHANSRLRTRDFVAVELTDDELDTMFD